MKKENQKELVVDIKDVFDMNLIEGNKIKLNNNFNNLINKSNINLYSPH
jgi:hypothetical protein